MRGQKRDDRSQPSAVTAALMLHRSVTAFRQNVANVFAGLTPA